MDKFSPGENDDLQSNQDKEALGILIKFNLFI